MKNILMILTSHKELENSSSTTGLWLGEFTDPYYEFIDKGYKVTLVSPHGGKPPIDPRSELTENITSSNRRFKKDNDAKRALETTGKLEEVNGDGYDALFYPGGHGPMWDLSANVHNANLVIKFIDSGRPVGAICHGPAALVKAAEIQPSILRYKDVTGFSNTEEKLTGLYNNIPFKLEDRLKELGANYHSATVPFTSKVLVSGKLITGQNPASANGAAKEMIKMLEENH